MGAVSGPPDWLQWVDELLGLPQWPDGDPAKLGDQAQRWRALGISLADAGGAFTGLVDSTASGLGESGRGFPQTGQLLARFAAGAAAGAVGQAEALEGQQKALLAAEVNFFIQLVFVAMLFIEAVADPFSSLAIGAVLAEGQVAMARLLVDYLGEVGELVAELAHAGLSGAMLGSAQALLPQLVTTGLGLQSWINWESVGLGGALGGFEGGALGHWAGKEFQVGPQWWQQMAKSGAIAAVSGSVVAAEMVALGQADASGFLAAAGGAMHAAAAAGRAGRQGEAEPDSAPLRRVPEPEFEDVAAGLPKPPVVDGPGDGLSGSVSGRGLSSVAEPPPVDDRPVGGAADRSVVDDGAVARAVAGGPAKGVVRGEVSAGDVGTEDPFAGRDTERVLLSASGPVSSGHDLPRPQVDPVATIDRAVAVPPRGPDGVAAEGPDGPTRLSGQLRRLERFDSELRGARAYLNSIDPELGRPLVKFAWGIVQEHHAHVVAIDPGDPSVGQRDLISDDVTTLVAHRYAQVVQGIPREQRHYESGVEQNGLAAAREFSRSLARELDTASPDNGLYGAGFPWPHGMRRWLGQPAKAGETSLAGRFPESVDAGSAIQAVADRLRTAEGADRIEVRMTQVTPTVPASGLARQARAAEDLARSLSGHGPPVDVALDRPAPEVPGDAIVLRSKDGVVIWARIHEEPLPLPEFGPVHPEDPAHIDEDSLLSHGEPLLTGEHWAFATGGRLVDAAPGPRFDIPTDPVHDSPARAVVVEQAPAGILDGVVPETVTPQSPHAPDPVRQVSGDPVPPVDSAHAIDRTPAATVAPVARVTDRPPEPRPTQSRIWDENPVSAPVPAPVDGVHAVDRSRAGAVAQVARVVDGSSARRPTADRDEESVPGSVDAVGMPDTASVTSGHESPVSGQRRARWRSGLAGPTRPGLPETNRSTTLISRIFARAPRARRPEWVNVAKQIRQHVAEMREGDTIRVDLIGVNADGIAWLRKEIGDFDGLVEVKVQSSRTRVQTDQVMLTVTRVTPPLALLGPDTLMDRRLDSTSDWGSAAGEIRQHAARLLPGERIEVAVADAEPEDVASLRDAIDTEQHPIDFVVTSNRASGLTPSLVVRKVSDHFTEHDLRAMVESASPGQLTTVGDGDPSESSGDGGFYTADSGGSFHTADESPVGWQESLVAEQRGSPVLRSYSSAGGQPSSHLAGPLGSRNWDTPVSITSGDSWLPTADPWPESRSAEQKANLMAVAKARRTIDRLPDFQGARFLSKAAEMMASLRRDHGSRPEEDNAVRYLAAEKLHGADARAAIEVIRQWTKPPVSDGLQFVEPRQPADLTRNGLELARAAKRLQDERLFPDNNDRYDAAREAAARIVQHDHDLILVTSRKFPRRYRGETYAEKVIDLVEDMHVRRGTDEAIALSRRLAQALGTSRDGTPAQRDAPPGRSDERTTSGLARRLARVFRSDSSSGPVRSDLDRLLDDRNPIPGKSIPTVSDYYAAAPAVDASWFEGGVLIAPNLTAPQARDIAFGHVAVRNTAPVDEYPQLVNIASPPAAMDEVSRKLTLTGHGRSIPVRFSTQGDDPNWLAHQAKFESALTLLVKKFALPAGLDRIVVKISRYGGDTITVDNGGISSPDSFPRAVKFVAPNLIVAFPRLASRQPHFSAESQDELLSALADMFFLHANPVAYHQVVTKALDWSAEGEDLHFLVQSENDERGYYAPEVYPAAFFHETFRRLLNGLPISRFQRELYTALGAPLPRNGWNAERDPLLGIINEMAAG